MDDTRTARHEALLTEIHATEGDIDILLTCGWPANVTAGVPGVEGACHAVALPLGQPAHMIFTLSCLCRVGHECVAHFVNLVTCRLYRAGNKDTCTQHSRLTFSHLCATWEVITPVQLMSAVPWPKHRIRPHVQWQWEANLEVDINSPGPQRTWLQGIACCA
jgi:hypothetical protein